jgi:exodeoxyribonuclease-3
MKIASWNVNSIRVRIPHVTQWINEHSPDVLLLQETKCMDEVFPKEPFEDMGYNLAIFGQKTFNGVAILSKYPIEDVTYGLPTFLEDVESHQTRYIEAFIKNCRIASVYIPNGATVNDPKFQFKMRFLNALNDHLESQIKLNEPFVIGGDFNIAPMNDDIYDPIAWKDCVLFTKEERAYFYKMINMGFVDTIRAFNPQKELYTWWDYQRGSYQKNLGARIDHLLVSPQISLENAGVDPSPRGMDKASDHVPIWCTIS